MGFCGVENEGATRKLLIYWLFNQLIDLGIYLRFLVVGQFDPSKTAFIINRDCGTVFDSPANVVNVDVLAKYCGGVYVVLFYRRSSETDERSVRQGVAEILREAIGDLASLLFNLRPKAVLAAMRLIGNDDDVLPFR